MHLTWSEAAYDPFGAPLPTGLILPGRPLVFQRAGCWDCLWTAAAKTYAEICEAREVHVHQMVEVDAFEEVEEVGELEEAA
jgi:hypothetical protein